MHPKNISGGVAFVCEETGKIVEVIANSLSGAEFIERDSLFPAIVDRESMGKALSFLLDIRRNRLASDWELNVTLGGKTTTLHFYGSVEENKLLIVGALNNTSALQLMEKLTQIEISDKKGVGGFAGARSRSLQSKTGVEDLYWDELSRLYNELSNLQRESAKQNVELQRLNELKNQFLGTAAHDLRNPIWMIRLYSQFLLEDASAALNEEQVEFLTIIKSHSENMQQLVDSYLDYSTIESGKLKLELNPSELNALVINNIHMNQPLAAKKQIELSLAQNEQIPTMNIDAVKINQVLNNL
ncbi:MAG: HAMP domain-containing sensor histidine kinase, partial [Candidatus Aminicenantes bacterium]